LIVALIGFVLFIKNVSDFRSDAPIFANGIFFAQIKSKNSGGLFNMLNTTQIMLSYWLIIYA